MVLELKLRPNHLVAISHWQSACSISLCVFLHWNFVPNCTRMLEEQQDSGGSGGVESGGVVEEPHAEPKIYCLCRKPVCRSTLSAPDDLLLPYSDTHALSMASGQMYLCRMNRCWRLCCPTPAVDWLIWKRSFSYISYQMIVHNMMG